MTLFFGVIYQGEHKFWSPWNVGWELFAQLQKSLVKFEKMPQKGKIGFKFFSHPNICQIVTFGAFSNFKDFFSLVLLQPTIFSTFEKISPENRVLKGPKWKSFKNKNSDKSYYLPYVRMWKFLNPILPLFGHVFQISPKFFAIVQKAPIPHFRDCPNFVPLGK